MDVPPRHAVPPSPARQESCGAAEPLCQGAAAFWGPQGHQRWLWQRSPKKIHGVPSPVCSGIPRGARGEPPAPRPLPQSVPHGLGTLLAALGAGGGQVAVPAAAVTAEADCQCWGSGGDTGEPRGAAPLGVRGGQGQGHEGTTFHPQQGAKVTGSPLAFFLGPAHHLRPCWYKAARRAVPLGASSPPSSSSPLPAPPQASRRPSSPQQPGTEHGSALSSSPSSPKEKQHPRQLGPFRNSQRN